MRQFCSVCAKRFDVTVSYSDPWGIAERARNGGLVTRCARHITNYAISQIASQKGRNLARRVKTNYYHGTH